MPLLRTIRRRLTGALLYALSSSTYHAVRALPPRLAYRLGRAGGALASRVLRSDARRAARQMERPAPGERPAVADVFRHLGLCVAEACTLPRDRASLDRMVTVEGEEILEQQRASEQGTVWVSGHTGNWELPAAWAAARGVPLYVIAAPIHYRALDRWVRALRERHGIRVLTPSRRDLYRASRLLRQGAHVAMLIDQRLPGRGTWIPFLGQPAWTTTGAARLARAAGVPVALATSTRIGIGKHRLRFGPVLEVGDDAAIAQVTTRLSQGLEDVVRSRPEQWVWMHDRWAGSP